MAVTRRVASSALALGTLGLFGLGLLKPAAADPALREIKIATSSNSFGNISVQVAAQLGLFAKYGLRPQFIVMDSANTATTALLAQSVDFALAGPSQALIARARRQPISIVSRVYKGLAAYVVLGKAVSVKLGLGADATLEQRFHALNGLSIAEPSPTSAYVAPVQNGAESVGAKINLVYMEQTAMPAALDSGAVQAIVLGSPLWGDLVLKGRGVLWIRGPAGEFPPAVVPAASSALLATEPFAAANPAIVKGVRAAMADLAVALQQQPDAVKKIIAGLFSTFSTQSLDLAFDQEWKNWSDPVMTAADVRQELRILQASGMTIPNLDQVDAAKMIVPEG